MKTNLIPKSRVASGRSRTIHSAGYRAVRPCPISLLLSSVDKSADFKPTSQIDSFANLHTEPFVLATTKIRHTSPKTAFAKLRSSISKDLVRSFFFAVVAMALAALSDFIRVESAFFYIIAALLAMRSVGRNCCMLDVATKRT